MPSVKHVALTLATYATATTGEDVRPGNANLMHDSGLSDSTVRRSIDKLKDLGWIVQTKAHRSGGRSGGPGRAAVFRLAIPTSDAVNDRSPVTTDSEDDPWNDQSPVTDDSVNDRSSELNHRSSGVESPVTHDHLPSSSHQSENTIHPVASVSTSPADVETNAADDEATFEDFWNAYPKRGGKLGAMAAWKKAVEAGTDPTDILTGAQRYATQCRTRSTEPRFIKNPEGWLTDERWTDEPTTSTADARWTPEPSDAYIWKKDRAS